ncbi:MAG: hypothetical protein KIT11_03985 [Fimbriimonadaceae bacterium]|nr:hypothetical protein [Fimbriimonadaceae bacterium]QYK56944.1 MAG: hypothetical protein KF733_05540 [Fimbriimonadaceae bacterium]
MIAPLALALTLAGPDETLTLRMPNGALFTAYVTKPPHLDKAPAVLFAPDAAYPMSEPLIARAKDELVRKGYLVMTMDWHFYIQGARPSGQLESEEAQCQAAVNHLNIHPGVDKARVVVVGKGLGSVVGWRVFQKTPWLAGFVITAPSWPTAREARRNYPGIGEATRPLAFIIPTDDAVGAPADVRAAFLAGVPSGAIVTELPGDHSFEVADPGSHQGPNLNEASVRAAIDATVAAVESMTKGR